MNPTDIEKKMMSEMNKRRMRYVFQYTIIHGFHVDFAFPESKVVIECDGDYWHANPKKYLKKKLNHIQIRNSSVDKERAKIIKSNGWKIIRFWGSQINNDVKGCVDVVEKIIKQTSHSTVT